MNIFFRRTEAMIIYLNWLNKIAYIQAIDNYNLQITLNINWFPALQDYDNKLFCLQR